MARFQVAIIDATHTIITTEHQLDPKTVAMVTEMINQWKEDGGLLILEESEIMSPHVHVELALEDLNKEESRG